MEGMKPTGPTTSLKTYPLATWSLILGIIGIVLCPFFVLGLLALIFGIVALSQINRNPGIMGGKEKAIVGIILGSVAIVLFPILAIIAAIAIPNLLTSRIAANQAGAFSNLRMLVSCEAMWRQEDNDMNGINDYWTYDVSSFYRMYRSDKTTIAQMIDISLARADGAPADGSAFDNNIAPLSNIQPQMPKSGYLFRVMERDERGTPYNQNEVNGVPAANHWKFAFVAYPATYSTTGRLTFIVNESGTIYQKDTEGKPVLEWPGTDPAAAGWHVAD